MRNCCILRAKLASPCAMQGTCCFLFFPLSAGDDQQQRLHLRALIVRPSAAALPTSPFASSFQLPEILPEVDILLLRHLNFNREKDMASYF